MSEESFRLAVLIPVFNHGQTVGRVISEIKAALPGVHVIAINDGSTDDTAAILAQADVEVLLHPANKGKGAALTMGFLHAERSKFTHALTMDADGQHDCSDAAKLIAASRDHRDDLIIGWRDLAGAAHVPAASKNGASFSRFWLHVQTGQDIPDSQCGMRIYPVGHVTAIRTWFGRFDYETEILARLAWAGITIRSVPIRCIYFAGEQRVSHYRPVRDTIRGVRVNVMLVARRLAPIPFMRRIPRRAVFRQAFGPWWNFRSWTRAMSMISRTGSTNSQLAAAIAVGVFIGLTPTFPIQTVIAIYLATRLHLNILAAVLGSQISFPLLLPMWAYLWVQIGNLVLHGQWMSNTSPAMRELSWSTVGQWFWIALVGSMIVASVMSIISLYVSRGLLNLFRRQTITETL